MSTPRRVPVLRWLYLEEAPQSGSAVLEIENPSGYVLYQPDGDAVVRAVLREGSTQLRDVIGAHAHGHERSTPWFFDHVSDAARGFFNYVSGAARGFFDHVSDAARGFFDLCEWCRRANRGEADVQCDGDPVAFKSVVQQEIAWLNWLTVFLTFVVVNIM